jgi:hypothetical protein
MLNHTSLANILIIANNSNSHKMLNHIFLINILIIANNSKFTQNAEPHVPDKYTNAIK